MALSMKIGKIQIDLLSVKNCVYYGLIHTSPDSTCLHSDSSGRELFLGIVSFSNFLAGALLFSSDMMTLDTDTLSSNLLPKISRISETGPYSQQPSWVLF